MDLLDAIRSQLASQKYSELSLSKLPKNLLWQPDLFISKDGFKFLVLVKSNGSIPPNYLNRISETPKDKTLPLIIFCQKPSITDEKLILSLGIGVGYYLKGKLSHLKLKKRISQREVQKEIKKKLSTIDIFISSKQDIPEREFVAGRIENLRKINSFPFAPPHLIEYDKFPVNPIKKLYTHIDTVLKNCEWIVIILEDNYSKVVRYEIKKAIKDFSHNNVFMFVKSTSACKKAWEKELNKVKSQANSSIKYLPYSDLTDLEVSLSKSIIKRMGEICKQKKVEIFV